MPRNILMATIDAKCTICEFQDEYFDGPQYNDPMPEFCPKCGGKMEKLFTPPVARARVIGGYDDTYGRRAQYRNMSAEKKQDYLVPDKETGKYKDPY